MDDPFNLQRFVDAQNPVYNRVCMELTAGCKKSHWIWFIFPQIAGLGHSAIAQIYEISSLDEARAYLGHSLLGPRLTDCTALVNRVENQPIKRILGYPDYLKFRSSMTLFAKAAQDGRIFQDALKKYYNGEMDSRTLELI